MAYTCPKAVHPQEPEWTYCSTTHLNLDIKNRRKVSLKTTNKIRQIEGVNLIKFKVKSYMFKYYIKKLRQLKGKVQQSFWDRKKVSLIISVTNKKKEIAQHVQCIVDYK